MFSDRTESLPVVMYHYVNDDAGSITLSPDCFEDHCRALAGRGWRGIGLEEAEGYLSEGKALPRRSVLLTFDDGFLDNYQLALPILARYGHRAVVFAVSNRLEAGDNPRISVEDLLAGRAEVLPEVRRPIQRTALGFCVRRDVFMNHGETRAADRQGVLSIASHSRGHYGVFTGPEYEGFFQPGDMPRTFYRTEDEPVWGLPNFQVKSGLAHRAFLPEPRLVEDIKALVPQDEAGAASFFAQSDKLKALTALLQGYAGRLGRYESDAERSERMRREIVGGKQELEAVLGRSVRSLCWPWGQYTEEAQDIARQAGFSVFFTTSEGANPPGRPDAVSRFKGKAKNGDWLLSRVRLYSRPWLGALYAKMRV